MVCKAIDKGIPKPKYFCYKILQQALCTDDTKIPTLIPFIKNENPFRYEALLRKTKKVPNSKIAKQFCVAMSKFGHLHFFFKNIKSTGAKKNCENLHFTSLIKNRQKMQLTNPWLKSQECFPAYFPSPIFLNDGTIFPCSEATRKEGKIDTRSFRQNFCKSQEDQFTWIPFLSQRGKYPDGDLNLLKCLVDQYKTERIFKSHFFGFENSFNFENLLSVLKK